MNSDSIKKLLEKYNDTLEKLDDNTAYCPGCGKIIRPPFFNLGSMYNWAEGCEDCFEAI